MTTPDVMLALALVGDDQWCVEAVGLRRHLVIQRAIRLARDPGVAASFPALSAAILGRVGRQRAARSWR